MKKLVFALGLTTVVFAGSTAWLAHELRIERARAVPPAQLRIAEHAASAPPVSVPVPKAVVRTAPPAAPAKSVAAAGASVPDNRARSIYRFSNEEERALARDELSRFTDPARRAAYMARVSADLRRTFAGVSAKLGLTSGEESRLFDLLARQQAQISEASLRCGVEPTACDKLHDQLVEQANHETIALLGQDRYDGFAAFRDSIGERSQVRELRARLPDDDLTDAQADRLALMLSEERKKFVDEATQRGESTMRFGVNSSYAMMVSMREGPTAASDSVKSGVEFSRRAHDRAAELLSPRQMEAFDQMQEEVLSFLRDRAHREEVIQSVRRGELR